MIRVTLLCGVLLAGCPLAAAEWPQWMGPHRDDVWSEEGIVESFPESGLTFHWRKPLSGGFSGPAVANGRVYITDYVKMDGDGQPAPTKRNDLQGRERILCLDAETGDELWQHAYDCPYSISYPAGPRCTPTVDGDRVYTLGAMGDLLCLSTTTGEVHWSKNLPQTYSAPVPLWGYAGHPLIYKQLLICMAGGQGTAVVALDKLTGQEVWTSLDTPEIGYSPPTLIESGGVTQLLIFHGKSLNSLNPDNGELYWSEPLATAFSMAIMAPRIDGDLLLAGGHNGKSLGLKLATDRPAVTKLWQGSKEIGLAPVSGTPFVEDGIAYGIDGNGLFRAVRMETGERLWSTAKPVNGQDNDRRGPNEGATFVTKNGNRFFIFGENGDLVIARLTPEKYEEVSRTHLLDPVGTGLGRAIVWSHPAYADQCIFARNDQEIVCASLSADPTVAAADFTIERSTVLTSRGEYHWSQSRPALLPGKQPRILVTTQEIEKRGSHGYRDIYFTETTDGAKTWSAPQRIDSLTRRPNKEGVEWVMGDLCPHWHTATNTLLITGKTFGFKPQAGVDESKDDRSFERVSYAVYSPADNRWGELRIMEMPATDHAGRPIIEPNAGCNQRYDLSNGEVLLPVRYRADPKSRVYTTIVCRCAYDGETLRYIEHGSEFSVPQPRGLYEPSICKFGDRYYLSMRAEKTGYVARGTDGLHFDDPIEWTFDDGQPLGSYNTQQHWITHSDGLYLAYTRRGANNDHVFRHRAPLFIARVDPDRLCMLKETEQVLLPETGVDLGGGFGVVAVSPQETWVVSSEMAFPKNRQDEPNRVLLSRVIWSRPNELFAR